MGRLPGRRAYLAVALFSSLPAVACRVGQVEAAPVVVLDRVPPAAPGGAEELAAIEGHVVGARPRQRVVLYAHSGAWYVQPFADAPFTEIRANSTWTSRTHLGTEYAALLVDPGFQPAAVVASLPRVGPGVAAMASVEGEPVFWRKRWFQLAVLAAAVALAWALHRFRVRVLTRQLHLRAEERLAERTRIAQDLYDTLLQGFLGASLQLHLAVDELPEDAPQKKRLTSVLRTMSEVVEEGRKVLHGLRAAGTEVEGLDAALSRVGQEADGPEVDFGVTVEGAARPLHPIIREEVYRVGREALVNAFRHARAKAIGVTLEYSPRALRLVVRDDGCGIGSVDPDAGGAAGMGLCSMRARAASIGARLRVRKRPGGGTEVDLSVPSAVAYTAGSPAGE